MIDKFYNLKLKNLKFYKLKYKVKYPVFLINIKIYILR